MYPCLEGTMCANCSHRDVCSLKDQFIAAQKAVDEVSVTLGRDGNKMSFKRLRDYDWIKKVKLDCIHFISKTVTPREAFSADRLGSGVINCTENQE